MPLGRNSSGVPILSGGARGGGEKGADGRDGHAGWLIRRKPNLLSLFHFIFNSLLPFRSMIPLYSVPSSVPYYSIPSNSISIKTVKFRPPRSKCTFNCLLVMGSCFIVTLYSDLDEMACGCICACVSGGASAGGVGGLRYASFRQELEICEKSCASVSRGLFLTYNRRGSRRRGLSLLSWMEHRHATMQQVR